MRMAERNEGCIDYRVSGKLAGQRVDVRVMARFKFNDITGAVLRHTQELDVSRCVRPPCRMASMLPIQPMPTPVLCCCVLVA